MMKNYTVTKANSNGVPLLILRPTENKDRQPGILWIHGGGYVTGMASMIYMSRALPLVKKYGAVVVTPEYRLADKAPYPAALEDCYEALKYLRNNAENLGIDDSRIMVGGESAGGGLTAALCMYALDKGEVNISFQMPLYPMLDNIDTKSSKDNHGISWNTKRNHAAWKLYLRDVRGKIPCYAAPARREDYKNLPPAYTFVGDSEAFYCETLTYIDNLKKAGIDAHVDVYKTGFHAFDMLMPWRKISREAAEKFEKAWLYAAENYRNPQE
ncbi:MAG: alpha/beta hydrolase [Clostridia bacterium]|nr:alpha/beta hydrolase [Clostridia bacterium]